MLAPAVALETALQYIGMQTLKAGLGQLLVSDCWAEHQALFISNPLLTS